MKKINLIFVVFIVIIVVNCIFKDEDAKSFKIVSNDIEKSEEEKDYIFFDTFENGLKNWDIIGDVKLVEDSAINGKKSIKMEVSNEINSKLKKKLLDLEKNTFYNFEANIRSENIKAYIGVEGIGEQEANNNGITSFEFYKSDNNIEVEIYISAWKNQIGTAYVDDIKITKIEKNSKIQFIREKIIDKNSEKSIILSNFYKDNIISLNSNSELDFIDKKTGLIINKIKVTNEIIKSCFSENNYLIFTTEKNNLYIYNIENDELKLITKYEKNIKDIRIDKELKNIIIVIEDSIDIIDIEKGDLIKSYIDFSCYLYYQNDNILFIGRNQIIEVFSVEKNQKIKEFIGNPEDVVKLFFDDSKDEIYGLFNDSYYISWNYSSGSHINTFSIKINDEKKVYQNKDFDQLLVVDNKKLTIFDRSSGEIIKELDLSYNEILGVISNKEILLEKDNSIYLFNHNENSYFEIVSKMNFEIDTFVSENGNIIFRNKISEYYWDYNLKKMIPLGEETNNIKLFAVDNDELRYLTYEETGDIRLWDFEKGTLLRNLINIQNINYISFDYSGNHIVCICENEKLIKLNRVSGNITLELNLKEKIDSYSINKSKTKLYLNVNSLIKSIDIEKFEENYSLNLPEGISEKRFMKLSFNEEYIILIDIEGKYFYFDLKEKENYFENKYVWKGNEISEEFFIISYDDKNLLYYNGFDSLIKYNISNKKTIELERSNIDKLYNFEKSEIVILKNKKEIEIFDILRDEKSYEFQNEIEVKSLLKTKNRIIILDIKNRIVFFKKIELD